MARRRSKSACAQSMLERHAQAAQHISALYTVQRTFGCQFAFVRAWRAYRAKASCTMSLPIAAPSSTHFVRASGWLMRHLLLPLHTSQTRLQSRCSSLRHGAPTRRSTMVRTCHSRRSPRCGTLTHWARNQSVTLHTNVGDMKVEVFCEEVPRTAENFQALCASGYYDGTRFHRHEPRDSPRCRRPGA